MLQIRHADERGQFDYGWLKTSHTFSFGAYYDATHRGFRDLRVMNEDYVQPGSGFGMHPHRDMEIITCILSGKLEHKDSLGNGSVIESGKIQRITAGSGIEHSESNPDPAEIVHLYQIWIKPHTKGLSPSYEERAFDSRKAVNQLQLIASPDGRDGSILINQNALLYYSELEPNHPMDYSIAEQRHVWVQLMSGKLQINDLTLKTGDGLAVSDESLLQIRAAQNSRFLLFNLD